ncbi:MAG: multicopper oxidase family protein [Alphaproteobacteria bacterium]|nr:multicopper oxidase family protein [Alphaproteobacteria bacterium]
MILPHVPALTRRRLLASLATGTAGAVLAPRMFSPALADDARRFRLVAGAGSTRLAPPPVSPTAVWSYAGLNGAGTVPGPEIRVRQGDRLRIEVENRLPQPTTVHWHGLRVPNAMDGVPYLNQEPIAPGATFTYAFDVPDAGTYWYHPHMQSTEQVGRGLYGPLIVEEKDPIKVDREVTWVLGDWRLTGNAAISDDFGNRHDMSHNGRVGNTVTINGRIPDTFTIRRGERIRLRLINAANARVFGLEFQGHAPMVIAYDGQPVEPHRIAGGRLDLGPAMRCDLILDGTAKLGERFTVIDKFYRRLAYRLVDLVYAPDALRDQPLETSITLPANLLPEPDLKNAQRHEVIFNGGMMGHLVMRELGGSMGPDSDGARGMMAPRGSMSGMMGMMGMMHSGKIWFINGKAATGHIMEPMLTLARDQSHVIVMTNATAWHHPIHLHGHSFRVLSRNGAPTRHKEWQDTVMMAPRETVEIAFVADNPGDWMFHCHILEHQAAGMMGVIRVATGTKRI